MTHVTDRCRAKRGKLCKTFRAHARIDSRGDTLRRITKAALGGLAGCALALGGTQLAAGSLAGIYTSESDDLKDLALVTNDGPFDSAKARTTITQTDGATTFEIRVTGIDSSAQGEFGAHLHIGPCSNSGGHYQHQSPEPGVIGTTYEWANPYNEVWIAIKPGGGSALGTTTVDFVPDDDKFLNLNDSPGKMSIVIHQGPLDAPGAKQACFPLSVLSAPDWTDGSA
jgi:hypothetical protein